MIHESTLAPSAGNGQPWQFIVVTDKNLLKAMMDRPLLIFHSGNDKLIPHGKEHADDFMNWAVGEKDLQYYPEGVHVCANYLDETDAYMIDWLNKTLSTSKPG